MPGTTPFPVTIRHTAGPAGAMIDHDPPDGTVTLWWHDVDRPTLIPGSAQVETVDEAVADTLGFDVVRRRSGGGLVVATPTNGLWLDVALPRGHPRWDDDVNRAFLWLGEAWANAIATIDDSKGHPVDAIVHRSRPVDRHLGRQLCFAGLSTGEVSVAGQKVVGLSQRRSRTLARFQCQFLTVDHRLDPTLPRTLVHAFAPELADAWRHARRFGWPAFPPPETLRSALRASLENEILGLLHQQTS